MSTNGLLMIHIGSNVLTMASQIGASPRGMKYYEIYALFEIYMELFCGKSARVYIMRIYIYKLDESKYDTSIYFYKTSLN